MAEKKITKKSPKVVVSDTPKAEECCVHECCSKKSILKKHLMFLGALVVLAVVLGYFFRDRYLAAFVNGKPIFRYKLNQLLIKGSGKDALESLIVEGLIKAEVEKNQIEITKEQVEAEVKKISSQFGDQAKFEEVLKAQGMSVEEFRSQIETKLQVYNILDKDISVSDEEISQFLKDSGETLTATSEAEKKSQAGVTLREQKLNEKIQTWIADLLAKAKITRFVK
jgi:hypothetical protein